MFVRLICFLYPGIDRDSTSVQIRVRPWRYVGFEIQAHQNVQTNIELDYRVSPEFKISLLVTSMRSQHFSWISLLSRTSNYVCQVDLGLFLSSLFPNVQSYDCEIWHIETLSIMLAIRWDAIFIPRFRARGAHRSSSPFWRNCRESKRRLCMGKACRPVLAKWTPQPRWHIRPLGSTATASWSNQATIQPITGAHWACICNMGSEGISGCPPCSGSFDWPIPRRTPRGLRVRLLSVVSFWLAMNPDINHEDLDDPSGRKYILRLKRIRTQLTARCAGMLEISNSKLAIMSCSTSTAPPKIFWRHQRRAPNFL